MPPALVLLAGGVWGDQRGDPGNTDHVDGRTRFRVADLEGGSEAELSGGAPVDPNAGQADGAENLPVRFTTSRAPSHSPFLPIPALMALMALLAASSCCLSPHPWH